MAALLKSQAKPLLIQMPNGALVPINGDMASAGPAAPVAAQMDDAGALVDPLVTSAGAASGNVAPAAAGADAMPALGTSSRGGAARGGALIGDQSQPAVLQEKDPTGGADDGLATILKLAQAASKGGGDGGSGATAGPSDSTGGGLMDQLRSLFHGADAGPAVNGIDPTFADKVAGRDPLPDPANSNSPNFTAVPSDAPVPTPRPALVGDPPAPRQVVANDAALIEPDVGKISAAAPGLPGKDPTFLDKLRENPLAFALITGGLQTMSAASRPGATPLGALGEGGIAGLKGAFELDASGRKEEQDNRRLDTADSRAASEDALRLKQGAFYDARTAAEPEKTGALVTRAGAAATTADARKRSADASMVRADAYAKGGALGKGGAASVFQQKQQAWLAAPGHENDLQGALDYAAGHKSMAGSDKYLAARRLATSQMNGMVSPPDDPNWLDQTTADIIQQMDANDASHGNGQPGNTGTNRPAPAAKGGPALGGNGGPAKTGALEAQAKAAIAKGADPAAVKARLKKMGGNPGAL